MIKIKLSKGKIAIIDRRDYQFLTQHKWYFSDRGYALSNPKGSRKERKFLKKLRMHRLVWERYNGKISTGMEIDHLNHNRLDVRLKNLRLVTHQQNLFYKRKQTNNKSGYKGVSWNKERKLWCAQICHNGVKSKVGFFKNKKVAAKAYNKSAKTCFGKYALLNNLKGLKYGPC